MDNTKTGGPAYPSRVDGYKVSERERDDLFAYSGNHPGKTLLDDFAGLAMQGLVVQVGFGGAQKDIAEEAYSIAAAMIAERNRIMNAKP